MSNISITLKNISMTYGENNVIRDFSHEFNSDSYVIKGASGIGKTTLLRIILGLNKSTGGEVIINKNGTTMKLSEVNFSATFQEDRLIEDIDAVSNIKIVCPDISEDLIREHLIKTGLTEESIHQKVSELSGGMKRRVAIVRSILYKSDVLILDEPLSGLNTDLADKVVSYIKENTNGRLLIVSSHSNLFESFCKEIVM